MSITPEMEQMRAELKLQITKRLIRHSGVDPHAGQRVTFHQPTFILVVAHKGHGLDADAQFALGSRVYFYLPHAVNKRIHLGTGRRHNRDT